MRRLSFGLVVALLAVLGLARPVRADSGRRDDLQRIRRARVVFHEILNAPDSGIPQELLESAKCIAIIPGEKQFAFLLGGQYGKGLVTCRTAHGWSAPVFLTAAGGSIGFQVGGSSTDLIMIFRNHEGIRRLLDDKFKIGADVTAAAGPVGRHAAAATDLLMHAEILTYSRSRGLFAGVSLDGTMVEPDRSADRALYGRNVNRKAILSGKVPAPLAAQGLLAEISRYTREEAARTRTKVARTEG